MEKKAVYIGSTPFHLTREGQRLELLKFKERNEKIREAIAEINKNKRDL